MMLLHALCPCNINAIAMTTVTSSEIIHLYNCRTSSEGKTSLQLAGRLLSSKICFYEHSNISSTFLSSKGYHDKLVSKINHVLFIFSIVKNN